MIAMKVWLLFWKNGNPFIKGVNMSYQTIDYSVAEGVGTVRLNRPESLNSFTSVMHEELRAAFKEIKRDSLVRCVVITGTGKGFCAGQDLNDRTVSADTGPVDLGDSVEKNYNPLIRTITSLEKPVLCAVNGVAAGAGVSLVLACDMVYAARSSKFVMAFSKIGVIPDSGSTWHLPRSMGLPRAMGLALTGDRLSAEQAERWGMIWQVVDDESLMEEVNKQAAHFATQPTTGLALIKRAMRQSLGNTLDDQLNLEKDFMRLAGRTDDYREGVQAFTEKRKPVFTGK
jgi:2-(1,2-epoxy-1,2-dihydrophenyl)acetyl-CoA isomerase